MYNNYIDGKWQPAKSGKTFTKINPATGEEVGQFPLSEPEEVDKAVKTAKQSFKSWSKIPLPTRGEILRKFGDLMLKHKEELAKIETQEMGKVLKETRGDVQEGIDTAYYAFGEARRFFGKTVPSELPDKVCFTYKRPIGVAGLISPWNFPAAIPCWKMIPALLSGNTVVFKPSREAPLTGTKLIELVLEAGVPEGVVNLVHGAGTNIGEAIATHPDVGVVSFTGSVPVGARLAEITGKGLKRLSLELGGKNGQIVMDDANLELALEGALWGAFGTTGQRCTATSRVILHKKIHDKFVDMLVNSANKIKIGYGLDESVEMGPCVSSKQRETVRKYVEIGKQEGAKIVCGGEDYTDGECKKGFFYRPTIFTEVKPTMRIATEEIFGPVLSVLKVNDLEEAIEVINNTEYGLSSSVYTNDLTNSMKAIANIEAGITYINAPTIGAECHLPFGGVKNTGNGHREGGWTVYETFTENQTVYIDYSAKLQKAQIDTIY